MSPRPQLHSSCNSWKCSHGFLNTVRDDWVEDLLEDAGHSSLLCSQLFSLSGEETNFHQILAEKAALSAAFV